MRSIDHWEGALVTDDEVLLMIKNTAAQWPARRAPARRAASLSVPELIALPVADPLLANLQWDRRGCCA